MDGFKDYVKPAVQPMRPYVKGEDLTGVSVSDTDNPEKDGGMIAVNPKKPEDKWFVAQKFFEDNYVEAKKGNKSEGKSLDISEVKGAKTHISDLNLYGDGDTFRLLCKASSQKEGWMKSTKVCNVTQGCIVQVTTQQRNPDGSYSCAEALTFVPGSKIDITSEPRKLVPS